MTQASGAGGSSAPRLVCGAAGQPAQRAKMGQAIGIDILRLGENIVGKIQHASIAGSKYRSAYSR
jgi:hypothetical protein